MNTNLDKIALDLYGKIETRFSNIKMGDEHGEVLSKKTDIPKARFFEFEYKEDGERLGTIAITLDEDDGIIVEISGDLADSRHRGAFRFIRSFRQFAKNRLLNFDVQNIGKDNLDKRDYEFKAKPKEEMMAPIMENKFYGNARMSYQDLGEAKLIIKHSQPVNPELAAGRSMHIESIYIENADGERFKYPFKHINGARALAEHIKAGGIPYDAIGKHITSLSEELAQLRKFKNYVGRNDTLSEAMDDINGQVMERIEAVKKEVSMLQRPAYYQSFAESFAENESQEIPEDILNDWIDRLTIRTFNEELKTAFPYIYRLVGEAGVPVKGLNPDDILSELRSEEKDEKGNVVRWKEEGEWKKSSKKDARGKVTNLSDKARRETEKLTKEEIELESFFDNILAEDENDDYGNGIFDENPSVKKDALDALNDTFNGEFTAGVGGINLDKLTKLVPDPAFIQKIEELKQTTKDSSDKDVTAAVEYIMSEVALENDTLAEILENGMINFNGSGDEVGGEEPVEPPADIVPPPEPAPEAVPPAPEAGAVPPPEPVPPPAPAPVAESVNTSKLKAKLIKAKECGATLETVMDFGHKAMTLHDAMRECGINPTDCGYAEEDAFEQMKDLASGFFNREEGNTTIGPTRILIKAAKEFPDHFDQDGNPATPEAEKFAQLVNKLDPMSPMPKADGELGRIKQLSGSHSAGVDEDQQAFDMNALMQQLKALQDNPQAQQQLGQGIQKSIGDKMADVQKQMPNQSVQFPGGQMNPADMMKQIMQKINFGN